MSRIEAIQKMLEDAPQDTFLLYSLGMELLSAGSGAEAAERFNQVLQLDRTYLAAYGAALGEVVGTGLIGASVSALIVDPLFVGRSAGWVFFVALFSVSSIAGAIIGLLSLGFLGRAGYWK